MTARPIGIPHARFLGFIAALLIMAATALSAGWPIRLSIVTAFDIAALGFIASTWPLWRKGHDASGMRKRSERDDGGRVLLLLLSAIIGAAVLVSIVGLLGERTARPGSAAILAIGTEVIAWLFANVVYAFHYARLYYDRTSEGDDRGGIELPGGEAPDFADFVTFAFVIGMTCQTADIDISDRTIRRTATLQGLLAFFFNLGVLAITVNVVAGLL